MILYLVKDVHVGLYSLRDKAMFRNILHSLESVDLII